MATPRLLLALLHLLLLPSPSTGLLHAPSLTVPTSTSGWPGVRSHACGGLGWNRRARTATATGAVARGRVAPLTAADLSEVTAEEIFEGDIVTYSLDEGGAEAEAEAEGCSEALGKLRYR